MNSDEKNPEESILIVEDNPINQALIQKELNKKGFISVLLANNGKEALELTLKHHPSLILMDIQLPDMNGNDVARQLRDKNYKKPIIAISADVAKEDINKSLNMGINEYISKPIDFEQLFNIIKKYSTIKKYFEKADQQENKKAPEKQKEEKEMKKEFKIPDSISEQVLNIFFMDAEEKLKTIEDTLKNDLFEIEIDKIKAIAHEYKGTASYFGLKSLERIAIELDESFKRPDSISQLKILTRKLMEILKEIVHSKQ